VVLWADSLPLELVFKTLEFGVRALFSARHYRSRFPIRCEEWRMGDADRLWRFTRCADARKQPSLTPREREIVGRLRQGSGTNKSRRK